MTREQRWHGIALCAFGAAIPVGEGIAFAAAGLLGLGLLVRRHSIDWRVPRRGPLRQLLLALAVWFGVGVLMIPLGGEGWLKPGELGTWMPWLAVPIVALSAVSLDPLWTRRAATAFILMLVVACVFGLVQYVFNVRPGETIARVAKTVASQGRVPGQFNRSVAGGFYFHRLVMAHVLLIGVGLLTARQLFAQLSPRRRGLEIGALALFGSTLLLTFTRGALLAAMVAVIVCMPFASRRWRWAAAAAALLALLVVLAVPSVRQRVASITGRQASTVRGLIWSQAVAIAADHPLGVGLGNYPRIVGRYYDLADPHFDVRNYPHSVVLAAWAETGPVGAVAYVWAWVGFMLACIAALRRHSSETLRLAAASGLFGAAALYVVGLTHDVLFHKPVALAFAGLLGLVLATLDPGREPAAAKT